METTDQVRMIVNKINAGKNQISVDGRGDRIYVNFNGFNIFNTNNNDMGWQSTLTFISGVWLGTDMAK